MYFTKPMASVTLNFVQKLFSLSSNNNSCQEREVSSQTVRSENIKTEIRKILIWDDPFLSCCCILFVNIVFCSTCSQAAENLSVFCNFQENDIIYRSNVEHSIFNGTLFRLIIYLDLRFYGIIFILLLILTFEQLWMEHFSRSNTPNETNGQNLVSYSSSTLNQRTHCGTKINAFFKKGLNMLSHMYIKVKFLRQSQPGTFCVLICLCFLFIGAIGKSFSGLTSVYFLLMAVMTVPGALVRFLPSDVIKGLSDFLNCSRKGDNDSEDEVEPYLLDTNEEALELLNLAGEMQLQTNEDDEDSNDLLLEHLSRRTNDNAESICSKSSLYPESGVMPSPENSMDFWESDINFWEKTESSENPNNDINFQSQHFDGDSSEEEFVRGLDLSEEVIQKDQNNELQQINRVLAKENLISVEKSLLVPQLGTKNSTGNDRESSSDTDSFELISEGDM